MLKFKVLVQITGSIAAYKTAHVISRLMQNGCEVQTVASASALNFIGAATLEGLTGKPVITDTFQTGHMMDHIHLARWADVAILCPATANSINKLAAGISDDIIGTLFLAYERSKPYLIAPAMNAQMLAHPVTQKSLENLKSFGVEILDTDAGVLACGEEGYGKLLDPDLIVQKILSYRNPLASKGEILVTGGGTREPIDSVRSITNTSTGRTAAQIVQTLAREGYSVTYLKSVSASASVPGIEILEFDTFKDLESSLKIALSEKSFKAVIHLAAVSDFHVENASNEKKIESTDEVILKLKSNPKLIDSLREWSKNKNIFVIGFKLTSGASVTERNEAVQRILQKKIVDAVVHNDLTEITRDNHLGHIFTSENQTQFKNKSELSSQLTGLLESL